MLYAALVHGATGIAWFCADTYIAREGQVIGMHPDTPRAYRARRAEISAEPLAASPEARAASRRMWRTVEKLNGELAALAPAVLTPTSRIEYQVAVRGESVSKTPVRTLLKDTEGGFILLVSNVDRRPFDVRFVFKGEVADLTVLFEERSAPKAKDGAWTDRLGPFGARAYRFRLVPAAG